MKYLKLFEAFESEILGSLMKFLSPNGKEQFLHQLKSIANRIDFPISKFSDDFFQYLPFKKALELNTNYEDEPGGTGIQTKSGNKLKWIKFWFDTKGNYITYTGVDGSVRKDEVDEEINNYIEVKSLDLSDFKTLKTGDKVLIKLDDRYVKKRIGTVYREDDFVYIIQDTHNGSKPSGTSWQKYGNRSWQISGSGDFIGTPYLLEPIEMKEVVKEEVNPYSWNGFLDYAMRVDMDQDVEPLIKKASFAIVLNYLDLQKSDYKNKSDTTKEREVGKKGALALMTDKQIRSKNINRYIEEISKRVQIDPELKNLKSAVLKMCGGQKSLAFVLTGRMNDFSSFINYLYSFIQNTSSLTSYQDNLKYYITNKITDNNNFTLEFEDCIDSFKKSVRERAKTNSLPSPNENNAQPYIEFIDKLRVVFNEFYEIIKKKEINTFDDTEHLFYKLNSMRQAWNNTQKFYNLRTPVNNLCGYTHRPDYFTNAIMTENLEKLNKDLEIFRTFVIRFIS
jgi:hypothetical protein